jgi:hypothetical protein
MRSALHRTKPIISNADAGDGGERRPGTVGSICLEVGSEYNDLEPGNWEMSVDVEKLR